MTLENSGCNSPSAVWRGISMRAVTVFAAAMVAWQAGVMNAAAQAPTATLNTVVVSPGAASTVTVTGTPGHYFALVGSTTNAGFAYAGVPFALGTDIRILAMGNLDGTGQAVVNVVPPFVGSALDRYYIQAVTSTSPSYVPLQTAPGNVLVNGDLAGLAASGVAGPAGPAGPEGPAGPAGPAGAAGATGAQGPAGADGAPGAQGPAGADGATGPQGAAGVAGPQGPQGVHGADGATGAPGTTGPQGVQGPQGPQGVQGVPGSIANVVVRTAAAAATSVTVLCEPGEVTFGGGGSAASVANNQTIIASIPVSGATVGTAVPATNGGAANGWRVTANVSLSLTAYVICGT